MDAADDISRDELLNLLELDRELNLFLDTDRRRAVAELLQESAELVQARMGTHGVWVRFAGPRTFDGQERQRSSIFSAGFPNDIREETSSIADAYRLENEAAGLSFNE